MIFNVPHPNDFFTPSRGGRNFHATVMVIDHLYQIRKQIKC